MRANENMLVVAMEECAEIQKEISKALRFGVNNYHPDEPEISNGLRIMREYHQLRAVMDRLVISRTIPGVSEEKAHEIYRSKIDDLEKWEKYSRSIGTVN